MQQERTNDRTPGPAFTAQGRDLTVEQALAMRDDQARLAAHYADRVERARAAGHYTAMRRSMQEYRRAAMRCRLLGERIRRDRHVPEQTAADGPSVLGGLAARAGAGIPSTGEAA